MKLTYTTNDWIHIIFTLNILHSLMNQMVPRWRGVLHPFLTNHINYFLPVLLINGSNKSNLQESYVRKVQQKQHPRAITRHQDPIETCLLSGWWQNCHHYEQKPKKSSKWSNQIQSRKKKKKTFKAQISVGKQWLLISLSTRGFHVFGPLKDALKGCQFQTLMCNRVCATDFTSRVWNASITLWVSGIYVTLFQQLPLGEFLLNLPHITWRM